MIDPVLLKPALDLSVNLLKPLIEGIWKWTGEKTEQGKFEFFYGSLATYIENSYKKHLFFTSLVFNNEQKKLDDFYLPLTLLKHPDQEQTFLDTYPEDLIGKYQRILIVDNAGMGKSTISKYIFLSCIRSSQAIPILIELRKLSSTKKILDYIVEVAGNLEEDYQRELILTLIKSGRFLFILDGYDEISDADRSEITNNLTSFINAASNNKFIMTSREEASLSSFPDFQRFTIRPLQLSEAYKLLEKYDESGKSSPQLISKLQEEANASIHEFLSNPMLTSLLFKSFEYKKTIPSRKHIFYRQVFDALFENHDLMKEDFRREKKSCLDIDQFDEFLRYLCFLTYKDGKYEYSKDELLDYISKTKQITSHKELVSSHFLHDLTHGVPLMVEEGNFFRWVHRSMQEYFAAQWVCRDTKEKQKNYLLTMYRDRTVKHKNIVLMCADIDPVSFRKIVIKEIITNYIAEYNSGYEDLKKYIPEQDIKDRKRVSTGIVIFIAGSDLDTTYKDASNRNPDKLIHAMLESLENANLIHFSATWNYFEDYIFGIVTTPSMAMNIALAEHRLLPFIKNDRAISQKHFPLNSIQPLELTLINNDAQNVLNRNDNFQNITNLLATSTSWSFDIDLASTMLQEIIFEENESSMLDL